MSYAKAVRKAVPLMVEMSGVSGCGKSTTALLLAAGMADGERVGFLDTENGRGSLLADDTLIRKALPGGYDIDELTAPFSPDRYVEKIEGAEKEGIKVLIVDSASHEYEGPGSIAEIAEKNKVKNRENWALAKRLHKKFLYACLTSNMDIIFCFRGRDRVKVVKGTNEYIELGVQPICEKSWSFDMTARWHIQEITHHAHLLKAPGDLADKFVNPRMLAPSDGLLLRNWKNKAQSVDPNEQLQKRARAIAEDGVDAYSAFFAALTKQQKQALAATTHADNKLIAERADRDRAESSEEDGASAGIPAFTGEWPDSFDGRELVYNGEHMIFDEESGNYRKAEPVAA